MRNVLAFFATLTVFAALVLLTAFAASIARSLGIPSPFSGLVAGAVFGVLLYALAKAVVKKFGSA